MTERALTIDSHVNSIVPPSSPSPRDLIAQVIAKGGDLQTVASVVKELVALEQSMVRFEWEKQERQAKIDFDDALNRCQKQIERVKPNKENPKTGSWWATYPTLDAIVRPIYTAESFSIAFSQGECPNPLKVRTIATVSRGGVSREFYRDITPPTKGPQGGDVMTATHGDGAAASYGRRYLLLDIFNIAVGIAAEDTDGNAEERTMPEPEIVEWIEALKQALNNDAFLQLFVSAHTKANEYGDNQAHLDIDRAAIKSAPDLPTAREVYKRAFAVWSKKDNDRAKTAIVAELEERKKKGDR